MRVLIWAVAILVALYSGYWFLGASAARQGAETAQMEAAARGVILQHQGLDLTGFPSRFDLTWTEPRITAGDLHWQAPFVQVFALSYSPWKLIAAFPPEQRLDLAGQRMALATTRMRASLYLRPETALPLDRFDAVIEGASLRGDAGWALGFASANASLIAQEGGARAALRLLDVVPDQALTGAVQDVLPATLQRIDFLADLDFEGPLALRSPATLQALRLQEAHLVWGDLRVTASGDLRPDAAGLAEGRVTLRVEGWQTGLAAAERAGLVPPQFQTALRSVLENLAAQSPEAGLLTLPLVMGQGRMMLGPLPLGAAPRLR